MRVTIGKGCFDKRREARAGCNEKGHAGGGIISG